LLPPLTPNLMPALYRRPPSPARVAGSPRAAAALTAVSRGLTSRRSASPSRWEAQGKVLRIRWTLCRYRHNVHYPDTAVMPISGREALVGGGGRVRDIGIITGLPGRPAAGRAVCSGLAGLLAGGAGRGRCVCGRSRAAGISGGGGRWVA